VVEADIQAVLYSHASQLPVEDSEQLTLLREPEDEHPDVVIKRCQSSEHRCLEFSSEMAAAIQ
jgi:hypothetical protein